MKLFIKKILSYIGLWHPSLGIKISPQRKAEILLEYKNSDILVETGTEFGTMVENIGHHFKNVYTIELDKKLYLDAEKLFKDQKHIKVFHGNSAVKIQEVLNKIEEPALFWLDAHGTGAMTIKNAKHCPVKEELQSIFSHHVKKHVILIDDARHFDKFSISVIKNFAKRNKYLYSIKEGVFRLTPVTK